MHFSANDVYKNRQGLTEYFRNHVHREGIIVSEKRKFIYMKPTKTAGTSLLRYVLEHENLDVFHQKDQPKEFNHWLKNLTDSDLSDYYIFSVVRNPWDRLVSVASYFNIKVKDFLLNSNSFRQDSKIHQHSLPQFYYSYNNGKCFVDMICRFESFQEDINLVFDQIGINRKQLPVKKKSKHKHYSYYFGRKEIEAVKYLVEKDVDYFGYMIQDKPKYRFLKLLDYLAE